MNNILKYILSFFLFLNISYAFDNDFNEPKKEEKNRNNEIEKKQTVTIEKPVINSNRNFKENNDLGKLTKYETMSKEEIISLVNNAYKKGFTDGSQETQLVMKAKIEKMTDFMDQLFAFHKLYLEGKLQPPKIGIVKTPVQVMDGGKTMVIEQEHLEIIEPAKFVEKPRDWKNFLW